MSRKVYVTLTLAQARALSSAVGATLDHYDAVEVIFPNPSERAAAFRAYEKLVAAANAHARPARRLPTPEPKGTDQ